MIQRVQTIYLLLAALLCLLTAFLTVVQYGVGEELIDYEGFNFSKVMIQTWMMPVNALIATVLSVGAIFLYSNRKRQLTFTRWAMLWVIVTIIAFAFEHYLNITSLRTAEDFKMHYKLPLSFPLIALIFLWLASKGIKKDEALIRSVDRLR